PAPVAVADAGQPWLVVTRGGRAVIPAGLLLENDYDPNGDPISVVPPSGPFPIDLPHGRLYWEGNAFVYWQSLTIPPATSDSFTYTITDGEFDSAPATVTLDIVEAQPFVATAKEFSAQEGVPLFIPFSQLLAGDGGNPTLANVALLHFSRPDHGLLDFCCGPKSTTEQLGTSTPEEIWGFWYVPEDEYVGDAAFTYTLADPLVGGNFSSAPVTIHLADGPDQTLANDKFLYRYLVDDFPDDTAVNKTRLLFTFADLKRAHALFWPPPAAPDQGTRLQFKLQVGWDGGGDPVEWIPHDLDPTVSTWTLKDYEGALIVETDSAFPITRHLTYTIRGAVGQNPPVADGATATIQFGSLPTLLARPDLFAVPEGEE
ncbi:MAG: Ig-like domain-containing protein, partial [Candidatus Rokuibacteriota bacterium]